MLKFCDEAVDWAIAKLGQLHNKRGYPDQDAAVEAEAKALLRIAHPVLVEKRLGMAKMVDGVNLGRSYESYLPTIADLNASAGELQAVEVGLNYGTGEIVNPLDWLIETSIDRLEFFPSALKLRELFMRGGFPPADGMFYAEDE